MPVCLVSKQEVVRCSFSVEKTTDMKVGLVDCSLYRRPSDRWVFASYLLQSSNLNLINTVMRLPYTNLKNLQVICISVT